MSDLTNVFTDMADAIRAKTQTQITYKPTEMANAINNIETGGGAIELTTGKLTTSFNAPVTIPDSVTLMQGAFIGLLNFNQPVNIPNSVTDMSSCFMNCYNFNQPITIPDRVTGMVCCFKSCYNFNQPITIPDRVTSMFSCFDDCLNFNQPVNIPNSVTLMAWCFNHCLNFNQPISIPNSVTNMASCFNNCINFNQPLLFPDKVVPMVQVFNNCRNFNQSLCLNTNNLLATFFNCKNYGSNVYIADSSLIVTSKNMFGNCNNDKIKRIICNNPQVFLGTTATNSITGSAVTWTQDNGVYFNTVYNIYIHEVTKPIAVLNNTSYASGTGLVAEVGNAKAIQFTDNVTNLSDAFSYIDSNFINSENITIFLNEGVTDMKDCFAYKYYFNQPLTIPSSVRTAEECLWGCVNFNSPVVIRNGVEQLCCFLGECASFDSDVWIPESVTNMQDMLTDCEDFETGKVHISHNITLGDTSNYIYNSLINGGAGKIIPVARILNDY